MGIYASVLPKTVACAYACSSNWYGLQLCLCRLLELQGRTGHRRGMFRCLLASGNRTRAVEFHQRWRQGPVARLGRGEARDVPWVLVSIWTSGQSKLGGKSLTCFSNWYGLCLCLCNLLGLWGRAGLGEDVQVCRAGQQSGS